MAKRTKKPAQPLGRLRQQAAAEAEALGIELVDVVMAREGAGDVLRFTIDRPGGVSLDDCEAFHRRALKLAQDVDYDYMEVSSPGADRPLKTERDFESALGQLVEAHFYRQLDGAKRLMGRLEAWDAASVSLDVGGETRNIARADISQLRLAVDEAELDSPLFDALEADVLEASQPDAGAGDDADLDDGGNDLR
ncbi:MAG TPA: hypothetical protein IAC59_06410 [Candidatus Fimadaptatus faecigallinarum]|uniref:Ribosome maturation factor RimP n=1 Tax=Candidatus Fimadaptatus faecigallinarum TaxID=2840814 RepID=A0A9D1LRT4_9FIRM|nr:hypothetical protein [Candidatus Fimadaptatus faecigallinarum]